MIEADTPELQALRRDGIAAVRQGKLDVARQSLEQAVSLAPTDAASLLHLSLILQAAGQGAEALDLLKRAAGHDPGYTVPKATGIYLSRRLRVREGASFEDGWLSFLDVALLSGVMPQRTLVELAALAAAPGGEPPIPRRMLQFWDKPQPPGEVAMLMERCKAANPDYEHALFCDADAQDFIATHYGVDEVETYRACFHVSAKADFFRLAFLYKMGGFYIDADEVCDRPLDPVFQTGTFTEVYSFSRGVPSCVNNWFIGTVGGTAIVERALEHCMRNIDSVVRHGRRSGVWVLTGPGALTFAILDIFCDPLKHSVSANPFRECVLIEEGEYRKLFSAPPMDYKATKEGNWRLI